MSLGADGYDSNSWQQWQQGWGDWRGMKGMNGYGMMGSQGMMNSGRYSPRMGGMNMHTMNGGNSPRGHGSPFGGNGFSGNYSGNDYNHMGSYRPGSSQHQQM